MVSHSSKVAIAFAAALLAACASKPELPAAPADLVAAVNRSGANECNARTASILAVHKVTAAMVGSVRYVPILEAHRGGGSVVGQTAWVYLNGQPGSAQIHFDNECYSLGIATDGGLRFPS